MSKARKPSLPKPQQFLVEGKCPAARIRLNPHIVMRSNLDLFLERAPGENDLYRPDQLA